LLLSFLKETANEERGCKFFSLFIERRKRRERRRSLYKLPLAPQVSQIELCYRKIFRNKIP
jgi:hypothetical protein